MSQVVYDVGAWRLTGDGRIYRSGSLRSPNGDVYSGEFINQKRHGRGKLKYATGSSYHGDFKNGQFHGFGELKILETQHPYTKKLTRGETYQGHFHHGKRGGTGLWITRSGTYDGDFVQDAPHGHGKMSYKNGMMYNGPWHHGKWHGKNGQVMFKNGDSFSGSFDMMAFHGEGTYLYAHQGSYTGNYFRGKCHGVGKRIYGDASMYTGMWINGEPTGEGTLSRSDGMICRGTFMDGKAHGNGIILFNSKQNSSQYDGELQQGIPYGRGTWTYADGGTYEGEYTAVRENPMRQQHPFPHVNGLREGWGKRTFSNGNQYEGPFVNNVMEGIGTLQMKNGMVYTGEFHNNYQTGMGKLSIKSNDRTRYEFPPGSKTWHSGTGISYYEGGFIRGEWNGTGTLKLADGRKYTGGWKGGKRHGAGKESFIPISEEGDASRSFVGGRNAMYRIARYVGDYMDNIRVGRGTVFYCNGEAIEGTFQGGHAHGTCTYIYKSGKRRCGTWERGTRLTWHDKEHPTVESTGNQSCNPHE